MKQHRIYFALAAICLFAIILLSFSCYSKGEANGKPRIIKKDTTLTLAAFVGYQLKSKHWGIARRISRDSLMVKWNKDSTKAEPNWGTYTYYEAEIPILVDSEWNRVYGDPLKDSLGRPNVVTRLMTIPAKYVRDTIYDLDSALRYLDQFLVKDSTKK